jgi:UDP-glucose 4-epimerase
MKKILVTGGSGFVGSHIVEALRSRGLQATVLTRHHGNNNGKKGEVILTDVTDREAVSEAVYSHDGVIHAAGVLGTQESLADPAKSMQVNVLGSINVFDACRMYRKKAVYLSVANYGASNPYAISKSAAERYALMYNKEFKTQIAILRGVNIYGPGQRSEGVRKAIPQFIRAALRGEDLEVYGSGNQIMDLIYVTDFAELCVRALLLDHGIYDHALEAGMGSDITVNRLAESVIKSCNSNSKINHLPMRAGETPGSDVKADVSTLSALDYRAEAMTSLEVGMKSTVEWFLKHPALA